MPNGIPTGFPMGKQAHVNRHVSIQTVQIVERVLCALLTPTFVAGGEHTKSMMSHLDNCLSSVRLVFSCLPALLHPPTRRLLNDDEGLDPRQLSAITSSHFMHDVTDGHHGLTRGETTAAAAASAGGEVGVEETDNGKAKSGGGSKVTGGGGTNLDKEQTAHLSANPLPEGSTAGAGAGTVGDGNDPKSRGGPHNLKKTAVRLATKISEASMVRKGTKILKNTKMLLPLIDIIRARARFSLLKYAV